jgi:hypothetical protein
MGRLRTGGRSFGCDAGGNSIQELRGGSDRLMARRNYEPGFTATSGKSCSSLRSNVSSGHCICWASCRQVALAQGRCQIEPTCPQEFQKHMAKAGQRQPTSGVRVDAIAEAIQFRWMALASDRRKDLLAG